MSERFVCVVRNHKFSSLCEEARALCAHGLLVWAGKVFRLYDSEKYSEQMQNLPRVYAEKILKYTYQNARLVQSPEELAYAISDICRKQDIAFSVHKNQTVEFKTVNGGMEIALL